MTKAIKTAQDSGKNIGKLSILRGGRKKRLLSEAIQLEEEITPEFIRPALILILIFIGLFIFWASTANINEITSATGEVVPSDSVKVVEHLEGGAIAEILVKDGSVVKKGQPLIILDGKRAISELKQSQARLVALRLREERLAAISKDRMPDFTAYVKEYPRLVAAQKDLYDKKIAARSTALLVVNSQLKTRILELNQMKKALIIAIQKFKVAKDLLAIREKMIKKKLISQVTFLDTKRAKITSDGEVKRLTEGIKVSEQAVIEARNRILDIAARLQQDAATEMGSVSAETAQVNNSISRLQDRVNRLKVRSPTRGVVQNLRVLTIGQIIQPGSLIMQIVPTKDTLIAEVKISPNDVGNVKIGQNVLVKIGSYNYSRFGGIKGTLTRMSASSLIGPKGRGYFRGRISLSKPYVGNIPGKYIVLPGMSVNASIATGKKTLLQYLLKPLSDAMNRAFSER
ncbi:MAG TPA: HlyD family type I secretion periplasmic adaptor subunit [Rhodospirillales bacterium]|nr:HlyD family type I secretion periplasmic adaptor subunit [Rhodospirillales bacterium]